MNLIFNVKDLHYEPVVRAKSGHYSGAALVGTHSVIIGWTIDNPAHRDGLHGFAIRRSKIDPATNEILETFWLKGYKRFIETDEGQPDDISSLEGPFQRFRWNDYSLKSSMAYLFEIFPMRGTPKALTRNEAPLKFLIRPSDEEANNLGVFVNRGVTSANAYLRRFKNNAPKDVGPAAYAWLSRGLKESLIGVIQSAKNGEALHIAIYEFFDHEIAQTIKDAVDRGVSVKIVHDAKAGKKSTRENEEVLTHFGLKAVRVKRNTVNISHNKIVIHLKNNKPVKVWSGSANFSENAFNFQTNTALIIRDKATMAHYEAYFQALVPNPSKAKSKLANKAIMELANETAGGFTKKLFFSPISKKDILITCCQLIREAKSMVLISAPFGVDKSMIEAMDQNEDAIIEYGLVNSTAKKKIEKLHRKNTRFFTPKRLKTFMGKSWDAKAFGAHKIHAKSIVIDPYGDNPKVLIGSANFSNASCRDNDENAMLISGNKRLAAIIATEFMRMYDHYKSRYYLDMFEDANKLIKADNKVRIANGELPKPLKTMDVHLKSGNSWSNTSFNPRSNSHKNQDRIAFSGSI